MVVLSPLHVSWWAAYKDRSHSNDEKVLPETMYFATPSDIYRHISPMPGALFSVMKVMNRCFQAPKLQKCSIKPTQKRFIRVLPLEDIEHIIDEGTD